MALSSAVLDDVTYGATLDLESTRQNFGLGLNYTRSLNVDKFGVTANARYVF